jgi:hypothetical protein
MGMVNAMGAIAILGFIVWARLGQYVVNFILNIIYFMLEFKINQQDCNSLFCVLYLSKPVNLHKIKFKSIETTRRYTLKHYKGVRVPLGIPFRYHQSFSFLSFFFPFQPVTPEKVPSVLSTCYPRKSPNGSQPVTPVKEA